MAVEVCPACGYPTIGPDPCAFCRPIEMLVGDRIFGPNAWDRSGRARWPVETPTNMPTAI